MHPATSILSFSGHETFPFRYSWLKKGLDAVTDNGTIFLHDDAMISLGVGKNMVRAIRHWCLGAGVIDVMEGANRRPSGCFKPTGLGTALLGENGWDPYLEDPATLWLLHWQIASNLRRCTTWFWAFSHFHEPEFTRETLSAALLAWTQSIGAKRIVVSSLKRDLDCFLRTYVSSRQTKVALLEDSLDCPLVELGLVRRVGEGHVFQFQRGAQPQLPNGVLFYAVLSFWENFAPGTMVLALSDMVRRPGSPGQVFKLDESAFAERCADMERWTEGAVSYDETAGLKQLYRRRPIRPADAIERAYASLV